MKGLDEHTAGPPAVPERQEPPAEKPLYTRYCAAPPPAHPVGEPRLLHTMLIATWLGRLIDPLPHKHHHPKMSGS